jgi:hypothetical protein
MNITKTNSYKNKPFDSNMALLLESYMGLENISLF